MHYKTNPYERFGWGEEMIFVKTCSYITFVDWLQNSGRNVIYVWGIKWIHVCSNRACEKIIHYCFNRACIQSSFAGILLINVTSNVTRVSLFSQSGVHCGDAVTIHLRRNWSPSHLNPHLTFINRSRTIIHIKLNSWTINTITQHSIITSLSIYLYP